MQRLSNRYLFTVRQPFGEPPIVDCFYKVQSPAGLSGDQFKVMTGLNPDFAKEELEVDSNTLRGIELRLRANTDMYQKVCMVLVDEDIEFDADHLESLIQMKHRNNELMPFLEEAAI